MDELIEAIKYDFECLCDEKLLAIQKLEDDGESEMIELQNDLYQLYKSIANNPERFIHKMF